MSNLGLNLAVYASSTLIYLVGVRSLMCFGTRDCMTQMLWWPIGGPDLNGFLSSLLCFRFVHNQCLLHFLISE